MVGARNMHAGSGGWPYLAILLFLALTAACSSTSVRSEASTLVRLVDELRAAPNHQKRPVLEKLRAFSSSEPQLSAARQACLLAFEHHVRGVELGSQIGSALDAGSALGPSPSPTLAPALMEMNVEIEEAQQAMPACEEQITQVRVKYRP